MGRVIKKVLITPQIHSILDFVYETIQVDNFIFYGGALFDIYMGMDLPVNDIDIAIPSKDKTVISNVIKNLKKQGYKIVEKLKYYKNVDIELLVVYAIKGDSALGIAFMEDVTLVGQFGIGSMYCRFPERVIVDKFNSISDLKHKRLKLIRNDPENPFLQLGIMMKLAAKYDIDLTSWQNKLLVERLIKRAKLWYHPSFFHNKLAKASALSSLLKSTLRSRHKLSKFASFKEVGLLELFLPEINNLTYDSRPDYVESKKELVILLSEYLDRNSLPSFLKRLVILKYRRWDLSDYELAIFVTESLEKATLQGITLT